MKTKESKKRHVTSTSLSHVSFFLRKYQLLGGNAKVSSLREMPIHQMNSPATPALSSETRMPERRM